MNSRQYLQSECQYYLSLQQSGDKVGEGPHAYSEENSQYLFKYNWLKVNIKGL